MVCRPTFARKGSAYERACLEWLRSAIQHSYKGMNLALWLFADHSPTMAVVRNGVSTMVYIHAITHSHERESGRRHAHEEVRVHVYCYNTFPYFVSWFVISARDKSGTQTIYTSTNLLCQENEQKTSVPTKKSSTCTNTCRDNTK